MPPSAHETIEIDGSLGLETNVSHHSGNPKSFRTFLKPRYDVSGRILKRDGRGPTLGNVAGTEVQALWEYVFVDPVNGVETYHTVGAIDGGFFIYRWDGAVTWSPQTLPLAPTLGGRWGFYTAANLRLRLQLERPTSSSASNRASGSHSLTRAGTTATATTLVPHNLITGDVLTITGAIAASYKRHCGDRSSPARRASPIQSRNAGASPDTGAPIVASALTTIRWAHRRSGRALVRADLLTLVAGPASHGRNDRAQPSRGRKATRPFGRRRVIHHRPFMERKTHRH